MDILSLSSISPLSAEWMIVVKTTRFDDGHVIAWHIEQDAQGRCWPSKQRLDASLYSDTSAHMMQDMGIARRWSLALGNAAICLDEFESVCLRSPLPDKELGESHWTWCLDILIHLERRAALVDGQALNLESHMDAHPWREPAKELRSRGPLLLPTDGWHAASESAVYATAHWPRQWPSRTEPRPSARSPIKLRAYSRLPSIPPSLRV